MSVGTTNSCELLGSPLVTQIAVTAHTQGRTLFSGGIKRLATGRMCFTTQSYAHPLEVENHESCCITQCFGTGTIISMRFDCYHGRVDDELKQKSSKQLLVKQKVIPKRMQQSRQRSFEKQKFYSNDQPLYQSVSHCRCKRKEPKLAPSLSLLLTRT